MATRIIKSSFRIHLYSRELHKCKKCGFRLFVLTETGQRCVACGKEFFLKKKVLDKLKLRLKKHRLVSEA